MDKIKLKRFIKTIERDAEYYMKEYNFSQKEAYETIYEKYYICMRLAQNFVEIETREKIHNSFKEKNDEN